LYHVPKEKPERCHQLIQDRDEQFAVDITGQWRLVFEVDQRPIPRTPDGGIDLKAVNDSDHRSQRALQVVAVQAGQAKRGEGRWQIETTLRQIGLCTRARS
jgi:hypothetical protein